MDVNNRKKIQAAFRKANRVSIPLRGKGSHGLFLNQVSQVLNIQFPSPCGGKVVMDIHDYQEGRRRNMVSIPLRGKGSHGQNAQWSSHLCL